MSAVDIDGALDLDEEVVDGRTRRLGAGPAHDDPKGQP